MSRYIERAENVARVVDVNLNLSLDVPDAADQWAPLVETTGADLAFRAAHPEADRESVIRFLAAEPSNPSSILSCFRAARENARSIREIVSSEVWLHVNRAYLDVREAVETGTFLADAPAFLSRVKIHSHLFAGLMHGTMSHNEAWHFGRLGRLLERADSTSRLLDVKYFYLLPSPGHVGSPLDDLQWSAVLRSASALEMYRKQKRRRIAPRDVADFLLLDRVFPRSVRSCVRTAEGSLHEITGSPPRSFRNEAEKRLGRLASDLDFTTIDDVFGQGLHQYLQGVQTRLHEVGDAIETAFFTHAPAVPAARTPAQ